MDGIQKRSTQNVRHKHGQTSPPRASKLIKQPHISVVLFKSTLQYAARKGWVKRAPRGSVFYSFFISLPSQGNEQKVLEYTEYSTKLLIFKCLATHT